MMTMQRRMSWLVICGLLLIALYCSGTMILDSFEPDAYARRRHNAGPWHYPWEGVVGSLSLMAAEVLGACVALRRARSAARAAFFLSLALGAGFLATAILAMHAPPFVTMHLLWLLGGSAWCLLASVCCGIACAIHADREQQRFLEAERRSFPEARVVDR